MSVVQKYIQCHLPFSDWLDNGLGMSANKTSEKWKWNHEKIREDRTESSLFRPSTVNMLSIVMVFGLKMAQEKRWTLIMLIGKKPECP